MLRLKLSVIQIIISIIGFFLSLNATSQTYNLTQGWNLLGYSGSSTLPIEIFSDKNSISTVWKWNATSGKWFFYTPAVEDGGKSYAESKGYDFLTSINTGEGFWVNSKVSKTGGDTMCIFLWDSSKSNWNLNNWC